MRKVKKGRRGGNVQGGDSGCSVSCNVLQTPWMHPHALTRSLRLPGLAPELMPIMSVQSQRSWALFKRIHTVKFTGRVILQREAAVIAVVTKALSARGAPRLLQPIADVPVGTPLTRGRQRFNWISQSHDGFLLRWTASALAWLVCESGWCISLSHSSCGLGGGDTRMNGAFRVGVRAGLAFRRCSPIPPLPDSCHGSDYGICRLKGFPLVTPDVSGSDRREHRRALAAPLRSVSQNNDVLLSEAQPIPAVAYPPAASPQFDDKLAANAPNLLDGDHPFSKFWRAYNKALDERPILVKSATSFFGFLIGDIIAQNIVGLPFDYWRTFRLVLFGIFMDGPVGKLGWRLTSSMPCSIVHKNSPHGWKRNINETECCIF